MKSCPGHSANQAKSEVPPDISSRKTTTLAMTSACVAGGISGASGAGLLQAPHDLVGRARHVLLEPHQHALRVAARLPLPGGEHVEHERHALAEHVVDRAGERLVALRAGRRVRHGASKLALPPAAGSRHRPFLLSSFGYSAFAPD